MAVDLKALARRGALLRYDELMVELNELVEIFPDLKTSRADGKTVEGAGRGQRLLSAAGRERIAAAQRRRWAAARKAKQKAKS